VQLRNRREALARSSLNREVLILPGQVRNREDRQVIANSEPDREVFQIFRFNLRRKIILDLFGVNKNRGKKLCKIVDDCGKNSPVEISLL
jgi:hypothetical protein